MYFLNNSLFVHYKRFNSLDCGTVKHTYKNTYTVKTITIPFGFAVVVNSFSFLEHHVYIDI